MTYIIFTLLHNLLDFRQVNLFKRAKHWDSFFTHCTCHVRHRLFLRLLTLSPAHFPSLWLNHVFIHARSSSSGCYLVFWLCILATIGLTCKGWVMPWTGCFYSLWDTGCAKKWVILAALWCAPYTSPQIYTNYHLCIQTPAYWAAVLLDLHFLMFRALSPASKNCVTFVTIHALAASYFRQCDGAVDVYTHPDRLCVGSGCTL